MKGHGDQAPSGLCFLATVRRAALLCHVLRDTVGSNAASQQGFPWRAPPRYLSPDGAPPGR